MKEDPPFAMVNRSETEPDNIKGFTVDIIRELAKRMDFEYEFTVLEKGGSKIFLENLKAKVCGNLIQSW